MHTHVLLFNDEEFEDILHLDSTLHHKELRFNINLITNELRYIVRNGRSSDDIYGEYSTYQEAKEVFDNLFN